MIPIDIIKKYYEEKSELYDILVTHSLSVTNKALEIIQIHSEWKIDKAFILEASLLHDIGIYLTNAPAIQCFGNFPYICHGYLGSKILQKENLHRHALVCERHTGTGLTKEDIIRNNIPLHHKNSLPETLEEKLICFADKFYSKTQLCRIKTIDQIKKSLSKHGRDSVLRFEDMLKLFLG
ncbi:MAG: HDIG domain-containing protein [Candidatus Azobacteroides pseudotrichonymphae]|jgi:uncharacterized protein|uniref:HD domain-containing protein n=1 Tax=Azobacteroides pseudotrichonymphae genomovar. CFP2 TaxID=511995 RepID=B6YQ13_AZOPC|nr:HD domain-containing protein [Candidatus Azobacteroides pseudotrichonymphae]MDR0530050.1 HD domain-containing protein [Bacteroidales bacterium OttesenSCG-928-I14]BAG83285.1 conserved hypothetical protein [Candidatus Azobacteroides pseudotrichonymphae genomovar. CFP2]GMO33375.1 MAG: HDIG domain-containing protein [Candidatus Azobacteroides pseudotrichonymphae]